MAGRIFLVSVFAILWPSVAPANTGDAILNKDCASCHNLKGSAPQTLKELWERRGPDLFDAGNKYRQTWMVEWLQKPQRIRPAGEFFGKHIQSGAGGKDIIDTSSLKPHVALSKEEATSVANELVKLKPHDDLIVKEKVSVSPISKQMGEMVFDKFQGCLACHAIEPNYGGLSGPELYTAGKRLQPEYIASYIRNPQAWDPKSWMPNKHVSDANIQKLVNYIEALSGEGGNAK